MHRYMLNAEAEIIVCSFLKEKEKKNQEKLTSYISELGLMLMKFNSMLRMPRCCKDILAH